MTSLLWVAVLGGCWTNSVVYEKYRVAKDKALVVPEAPTGDWEPDVRVEMAPKLVDELVAFGLERQGPFRAEVSLQGVGRATPQLVVSELKLSGSKACESCFGVDLRLAGDVDWKAGLLGEGTVPATARLRFDVELTTEREGTDFVVKALPRDIRDVSVEVPGWSGAVKRAAMGPIERWLNEQAEKIEPIAVTRFGGEALPLLAMRVKARGRGLSVQLLSDAATPAVVARDGGRTPDEGFAVWVGYETLVALAARQAFLEGPKTYDISAIPTSLEAKRAGFTLGVRLWGLGGAGWWRDYRAHGGIRVEEGEVRLNPVQVEQIGMSKGAIEADPLIHLGQSLVLESITDALRVTLPNVQELVHGEDRVRTTVTGISGQPDALWVLGSLTFLPAEPKRVVP